MPYEFLQGFGPDRVDELIRELRARDAANLREDQAGVKEIALYGKPRDDFSGIPSSEIASTARRLQKVIYGMDMRVEVFQLTEGSAKRAAQPVVALVSANKLEDRGDDTLQLKPCVYGELYRLCEGERFWRQPSVAFGSGVLVAKNIVITAGHCIGECPDEDLRFVFEFKMLDPERPNLIIPYDRVFHLEDVIDRRVEADGSDWAVCRLTSDVRGIRPAPIRRNGSVKDASAVHIVGHPCGLPAKHADGARVVHNDLGNPCFRTNLDAFGGNSGSPVFGRTEGGEYQVEGLLVRGAPDFVPLPEKGCYVSMVIPQLPGGQTAPYGEECIRTTVFAHLVPELTA